MSQRENKDVLKHLHRTDIAANFQPDQRKEGSCLRCVYLFARQFNSSAI